MTEHFTIYSFLLAGRPGTTSMTPKLTGSGVEEAAVKKMSESQTKAGNQEKLEIFKNLKF